MNNRTKLFKDYIVIFFLSIVNAFNYEIFILKNQFAPSGINGVATMIQYLFNFNVGYMSLIINIPMLIVAFFVLNKHYSFKTLTYVLTFSLAMLVLDKFDLSKISYVTTNGTSTVLAPLAAGTISGFIIGVTFKCNGSTGGTDIVAAFVRKKKPYMSFVWVLFTINVTVAIISFFVYDYKYEPVLCCLIYCFVSSNVTDRIFKGGKEAIKFEIITTHPEELSKELISKLKHSVTYSKVTGMYSHTDKSLLICIVNKHQIIDFHNILKNYPDSFVYVSTVNETIGNFHDSNKNKKR